MRKLLRISRHAMKARQHDQADQAGIDGSLRAPLFKYPLGTAADLRCCVIHSSPTSRNATDIFITHTSTCFIIWN